MKMVKMILWRICYSIEFRIKEEIDKDASQYRSWWNDISNEWKY
jgi:hypothetical protein